MLKRLCLLICLAAALALCPSCASAPGAMPMPASPATQSDMQTPVKQTGQRGTSSEQHGTLAVQRNYTVMWNGLELHREDFAGSAYNTFVPENVLTTDEQVLTVYYTNGSGSDALEYGIHEIIQVNIDGTWYTLPYQLSSLEQPLLLPPLPIHVEYQSEESRTRHQVDLSVTGGLAPGAFRLVERFFLERLQWESFAFAYFWIIEPGGERPPESETTGQARMEDILLTVKPLAHAQKYVTDADRIIAVHTTNLSGKTYQPLRTTLERKTGGEWEDVKYEHANRPLLFGWSGGGNMLFLNEPLSPGDYRLRLSLVVFQTNLSIEPEYEFTVVALKDAPTPAWDAWYLCPSPLGTADLSKSINITLKNSVLNERGTELELTISADKRYNFGEPFEIEVLLDGVWYRVPSFGGFTLPLYQVAPDIEPKSFTLTHNPLGHVGALPAGQYRLIKEFDLVATEPVDDSLIVYAAKEFAMVSFMVETDLYWRQR